MDYDNFLLNDLTRSAAVILMSQDLENSDEFSSTDDIFESFLKFSRSQGSIMNYFLSKFEQILTMYIYARFGNLFNVIVERVKDTLVKFPIGVFVDNSNLIVIYSPAKLIEFVERLSMSIFLYSSDNGFIRNRDSDNVFNSQAMKIHDERLKRFLQLEKEQEVQYNNSFHDSLPREYADFFNGITGFVDDNRETRLDQLVCENVHQPFLNTQPNDYSLLSYSSTRPCQFANDDFGTDDALFFTSNYLVAQKMMLEFNKMFSEANKSDLMFLASIRTIMATAVRPIVDLFIVQNETKEREHKEARRRATTKSVIRGKLPLNTTIIEACREKHENFTQESSLRQQRLNIDVCVRQ